MQQSTFSPANAKTLKSVRDLAVEVGGYESFAEIAALALVKRLVSDHRPLAARRVLKTYLSRHPITPRIAHQLTVI